LLPIKVSIYFDNQALLWGGQGLYVSVVGVAFFAPSLLAFIAELLPALLACFCFIASGRATPIASLLAALAKLVRRRLAYLGYA
jgi:hypothetical protein